MPVSTGCLRIQRINRLNRFGGDAARGDVVAVDVPATSPPACSLSMMQTLQKFLQQNACSHFVNTRLLPSLFSFHAAVP